MDRLLIFNRHRSHYCWIKNFNSLLSDQNNVNCQYVYCSYHSHALTKAKLQGAALDICDTRFETKMAFSQYLFLTGENMISISSCKLLESMKHKQLNCIPQKPLKYISFSVLLILSNFGQSNWKTVCTTFQKKVQNIETL